MNHPKQLLYGVLVVAGLVFGALGFALFHREPAPQPGAVVSPEIPARYLCIGGVCNYTAKTSMTATSSVVCSAQNPRAATTSLLSFAADISANGLGAQKFTLSTSTTNVGSSSPFFVYDASIGANGQKSIFWFPQAGTTTSSKIIGMDTFLSTGESPYVVGPSEFVNLRVSTGTPGTFSSYLTGTCTWSFRSPL